MKCRFSTIVAFVATICVASSIGFAGCSSSSGSGSSNANPNGDVELQILAASSLSKALDEAQQLYTQQTGVTFSDTQYLSSAALNEKLALGSYADIEITASISTMDIAESNAFIDESTRINMLNNELVIISKEGSGFQDVTLDDIASGLFTLCLGDDAVPAGNYAAQALSTVGLYTASGDDVGMTGPDISGRKGSYTGITPVLQTSVENICKQVESGHVQLAIVTSSDAHLYEGVEIVGIIPASTHQAIVYPGAVCTMSDHPEEAGSFITWCITDPDAQKIWDRWGFYLD